VPGRSQARHFKAGGNQPTTPSAPLAAKRKELDVTETTTPTLRAAVDLARRGVGTLPLATGGKEPAIPKWQGGNGVHDATVDRAVLERWFGPGNYTNIGAAIPDDVAIIDVDKRNGGIETLQSWCDSYGEHWFHLPPRQATGGDGWHLWYRRPTGLLCHPGKGIECLRVGKYVLVEPSVTTNSYRWHNALPLNLAMLPDTPEWLAEKCTTTIDAVEDRIRPPRTYNNSGDDMLDRLAHENIDWFTLLTNHGFILKRGDGNDDGSRYKYNESDGNISASIKFGCLFVWTHRTEFTQTIAGEKPNGYTLFRAISVLEDGGDMKVTRRRLVRDANARWFREWS
jgi:hypothetical protein